jgi:hypothetical protein
MSTFDAADREAEERDAAARDGAARDGSGRDGSARARAALDGAEWNPAAHTTAAWTGPDGDGLADGDGDGHAPDAPPRAVLEAEVERLRAEVGQLQQAIESRAVIDQARGMVMVMCRCTPHAAWEVLVEVSQHTNTKLRVVANALVATTDGSTRMPQELSTALAEALRRRRDRGSTRRR